jgi:hypothetical protein
VVNEALAQEQPFLIPLPAHPYDAVLTGERRVSHEGMVSVGGNLYSVPDTARKSTPLDRHRGLLDGLQANQRNPNKAADGCVLARPQWAKIREKRGQYACEPFKIDAKSMQNR